MIDVKQAVNAAIEYLNILYDPKEIGNVQLEEVEFADVEQEWLVTIGFDRRVKDSFAPSDPLRDAIGGLIRPETTREYKLFHVRASDGKVAAMKIRTPWIAG